MREVFSHLLLLAIFNVSAVLGAAHGVLDVSSSLTFRTCEVDTLTIAALQVRELRCRDIK